MQAVQLPRWVMLQEINPILSVHAGGADEAFWPGAATWQRAKSHLLPGEDRHFYR